MSFRPVIGLAFAARIPKEKYERYIDIIHRAGGEARVLRTVKLCASDSAASESESIGPGQLRSDIAEPVKHGPASASDVEEVMSGIDGLFLPGGMDICPSLLKEPEPLDNGGEPVDTDRDISDYLLARYCMEHDIPVLAVCHGEQILGIADGCSLIQSMEKVFPAEVCAAHRMPPETPDRDYMRGEIIVTDPDSVIAECAKNGTIRNAALWHHQCLKSVEGSAFQVTAVTRTNGYEIIQAIERKNLRFCVGLQFHPEIDCGADLDTREKIRCEADICLEFFRKLVSAAEKNI